MTTGDAASECLPEGGFGIGIEVRGIRVLKRMDDEGGLVRGFTGIDWLRPGSG
jgi:hypothetical protein